LDTGSSAGGGQPRRDDCGGQPREVKENEAMAEEIRADMVANVWKVVASAGSAVAEGDTLVILESMKMEIPVVAETDGTLTQLAVNEGDVVQEGDLIAVIE
jgi:biotin carboxyl carrier protein